MRFIVSEDKEAILNPEIIAKAFVSRGATYVNGKVKIAYILHVKAKDDSCYTLGSYETPEKAKNALTRLMCELIGNESDVIRFSSCNEQN